MRASVLINVYEIINVPARICPSDSLMIFLKQSTPFPYFIIMYMLFSVYKIKDAASEYSNKSLKIRTRTYIKNYGNVKLKHISA